jgi:hypothetical protein
MIHYEMPKEIRNYVLRRQMELKIKKGNGKLSQQQTITSIIKEHMELTKVKEEK